MNPNVYRGFSQLCGKLGYLRFCCLGVSDGIVEKDVTQ